MSNLIKYGVCLTNYGDVASREASVETARLAEGLGFSSVWVSDHILAPPEFGSVYGSKFLDPFICLAYAAAETERVMLGTTVVVVPLRSPFAQGKMLSTLDLLSGGRVIYGIGAGWDREEFEALGVPFEERGAMTDEYIDIMVELWSQLRPAFEGRYHTFSGVSFEPKPLQKRIPIWVGGHANPVLRRAARIGKAWHPAEIPPAEIAQKYERIQSYRQPAPDLTYRMYLRPSDINPSPMKRAQPSFEGDRQQIIEYIESYIKTLPIVHMVFEFVVESAAELKRCFAYMAEDVLPQLERHRPQG